MAATSADQATFAAGKGKNWAAPGDPNFGQAGYIGQPEYDAYSQQSGGATSPPPISATPSTTTSAPPAAPAAPGAPAPIPAAPAGTPDVPPPPNTGANTGTGGVTGTDSSQFLNSLLGLLHPGTPDQNNPAISGAIGANNLALQRGAEGQRAQVAEQNAFQGTDASGGANTVNQGIAEDMAAKQGQFAGGEVQHLSDQQNQNMMGAIAALGSYLPAQGQLANQWAEHEATLTEQAREADVDAALKKLGIETQGGLGAADIALRDKLGSSQAGLTLLGLLQQAQEFGAGLDSSTMLALIAHATGG